MERVFNNFYSNKAKVDTKMTNLEWINKNKNHKETFVNMDLDKLLENRTIVNSLWGLG